MEMVIWFCFAVGCALLAQKKNRNAVGWFIWGIVGGIFALGILALLQPLDPDSEIKPAYKKNYKNCPFCSERIAYEAIVCKHCGRDLK